MYKPLHPARGLDVRRECTGVQRSPDDHTGGGPRHYLARAHGSELGSSQNRVQPPLLHRKGDDGGGARHGPGDGDFTGEPLSDGGGYSQTVLPFGLTSGSPRQPAEDHLVDRMLRCLNYYDYDLTWWSLDGDGPRVPRADYEGTVAGAPQQVIRQQALLEEYPFLQENFKWIDPAFLLPLIPHSTEGAGPRNGRLEPLASQLKEGYIAESAPRRVTVWGVHRGKNFREFQFDSKGFKSIQKNSKIFSPASR